MNQEIKHTRLVTGAAGELIIGEDGVVHAYRPVPVPEGEQDYSDITRIDLGEHRAWCNKNQPAWVDDGYLDILEVGFWTQTMGYIPASDDFREDLLANLEDAA